MIALLRRKTRHFGTGRILGLLLLASLLALRVWDPGPIEIMRLKSFDIYQLMYPRVARQERVAVVDIDERSLQALGQWPWPRTVMAEMVSKIVEHGGTVIGFDVLFPEPDRSSPEVAAETFQGLDLTTRETLRQLARQRRRLRGCHSQSKVVLGQSGYRVAGGAPIAHPPIQTGIATDRTRSTSLPRRLSASVAESSGSRWGGGWTWHLLHHTREGWRRPPRAGRCGCRRHDRTIPCRSRCFGCLTGSSAVLIKSDASGVRSVGVDAIEIPTDGKGRVWVHFSPPNLGRYVSAIDLLQGRIPAGSLAGKMVLIGTSAAGLLDLKVTPIHPALPGVELHAQLLESALTGATLSRPSYTAVIELALATILSLILIAFAPRIECGNAVPSRRHDRSRDLEPVLVLLHVSSIF